MCGLAAALGAGCAAQNWPAAVRAGTRLDPAARIVVIEVRSGRLLAATPLSQAARTLAAPGSALKPLALYGLIEAGRWQPQRRLSCDRQLRVGRHDLACSHPPQPPLDAAGALAWSCNRYFAAVAAELGPGELRKILEPAGLLGPTGLAPSEATAEWREPATAEQEQLALLGVEGLRVTPLELARAYRWLAVELAAHPDAPAARTVRLGMAGSAGFGMAAEAGRGGVPVLGKTGTAAGVETARTHGWFAGIAPASSMEAVVVVYLPAGRGADAARVAAAVLAHSPLRRP